VVRGNLSENWFFPLNLIEVQRPGWGRELVGRGGLRSKADEQFLGLSKVWNQALFN
jgi:hypothetical protein